MIEFSTNKPDKNISYTQRTGVYAVIENRNKLIALVKTMDEYFLPGGGLDNDESLETCLRRECMEEIGVDILDLNNFAKGNYYFYSTSLHRHVESVGYFFRCKIGKYLDVKTEADHELTWLDPEQAIRLLFLENHKEAIRICQRFTGD
jgi:8-oxo-dGTP diphosphatase